MHLVRPVLLPDSVCFCPELVYPCLQRFGFLEQVTKHLPHGIRFRLIHSLDHPSGEMVHRCKQIVECGSRFPEHSEEIRGLNVPVILKMLYGFPLIDLICNMGREVLLISGYYFLKLGAVDRYHVVSIFVRFNEIRDYSYIL